VALVLSSPVAAHADDDDGPYFYKGRDYGSESVYNPLTVFLNRGFDNLQLKPDQSNFTQEHWRADAGNVLHSVAHPFAAISDRGWGRFLRQEIFPLSWGVEGARWAPNYGLHLIGGGQTYAMLGEWYRAHDVPVPWLFSIATLYAAAMVNETLENNGIDTWNTDCLADLLVFDVAGILLFSSDSVKRFFSREIIVSDWSLQPSFAVHNGDLRNEGNYYALKWALPFYPRLSLFSYIGMSTLGGLSLKTERGYSISVAGGGRVDTFTTLRDDGEYNVVTARPAAAIFVDRDESLLVSLEISEVKYDWMRLNIYPNTFFKTDPGVGFFGSATRDGHFMAGLSFTRTLGVGLAVGKQQNR
jgi:hypothetical protein